LPPVWKQRLRRQSRLVGTGRADACQACLKATAARR
jgi:hypothetical protein